MLLAEEEPGDELADSILTCRALQLVVVLCVDLLHGLAIMCFRRQQEARFVGASLSVMSLRLLPNSDPSQGIPAICIAAGNSKLHLGISIDRVDEGEREVVLTFRHFFRKEDSVVIHDIPGRP